MSKVCELCGKKRTSGHNVSHSNKKTKRVFNPNLQVVSFIKNGKKVRVKACGKCIKRLAK